jgi:anti-sigma factor ChrR (cupin superfamily)
MKTRRLLVFATAFALVAAVTSAQAAKKTTAAKSAASRLSAKAAADLKWVDLDPTGAPGVKIADVWGDHAKGGFGAFIKFPAGFLAPLHTHTNDFKIVVISGTFVQVPEGKPELRLGPGSYLMQPGGNYRHTSACDKASECEMFVQSTGKFDLIPAEAAAKK